MTHPHIGWRFRFVIQRRKAQSVVVNKTCCGTVTDRDNCCYIPQASKRLKRFSQPSFDAPDIQRRVTVRHDQLISVIPPFDKPPFRRPHRQFCQRFPNIQDNNATMSHVPHPIHFD